MKLRRIRIRGMPGFEERQLEHEQLSPVLNVVTGPNGSGKTTTCRAVEGLLWPSLLDQLTFPDLDSEWEHEGGRITVLRRGGSNRWLRNGIEIDRDALGIPEVHLRGCFFITVDDLFGSGAETESSLAASVQRELLGGFNVAAIRERDELRIRVREGKRTADYRKAQDKVGQIKRRHAELQQQEASLIEQEARLASAIQALTRLEQLGHVRDLRRKRNERNECEQLLGRFHPCTARLAGDERTRLDRINDALHREQEKSREKADALRRLEEHLAEAGLSAPIPDEQLQGMRETISLLEEHERRLQAADDAYARLEGETQELKRRLLAASGDERLLALDPSACAGLEKLHQRYIELTEKRAFYRWKRAEFESGSHAELPPQADLEQGIALLSAWLHRADQQTNSFTLNLVRALWFSNALLIVLIVAGAYLYEPLLLAASGAPICVLLWLISSAGRRGDTELAGFENEYSRLSLEPLMEWTAASVTALRRKLEAMHQRGKQSELAASALRQLAVEEQTVLDELGPLEAKIAEARRRLDLDEDTSPLLLASIGELLRRYSVQSAEAAGMREEAAKLREDKARLMEKVIEFFVPHGIDFIDTARAATSWLETINQRNQQLRRRQIERRGLESELRASAELTAERERERDELLAALGFASDQEGELRAALDQREGYLENKRRFDELTVECSVIEQRIQDAGRELLELSDEQLERERFALEAAVAQIDELRNSIIRIQAACRQARQEHSLEEALEELTIAQTALEEERSASLTAAAAHFLLDEVESEYEHKSQPQVVREARRLLATFTRGRYELLGPAVRRGEFRAKEVTTQRELRLHELSSGTRMQLLLAVRVAFAERHEGAAKLPLFLDEVLSSADPERYQAIAGALLALAKEGRQIFYLSCQPSDAAAWETLAVRSGLTDVKLITVGGQGDCDAEVLLEAPILLPPVEPPNGRSLPEYLRALAIPSPEVPHVSALHLGHLVDSADTLYRLLSLGIERYGQLQLLAERGEVDQFISRDELARMSALASALELSLYTRDLGKGRRFPPEALREVAGQSAHFDQLLEVADMYQWNAHAFIAAIDPKQGKRVSGLRTALFDKLREALQQEGYYRPYETPLNKDEARARVFAGMNDHVARGEITVQQVAAMFERIWSGEPHQQLEAVQNGERVFQPAS